MAEGYQATNQHIYKKLVRTIIFTAILCGVTVYNTRIFQKECSKKEKARMNKLLIVAIHGILNLKKYP